MRVLAIDPGSTCGWAIIEGGRAEARIAASGTWKIAPKPKRGESPGVRYMTLIGCIELAIDRYCGADWPKVIAYEQAHQRGGAATEYAIGCATHIQSWCAANKVEHMDVHSSTIKSFAVGRAPKKRKKGDPKFDRSKDAVMAAARVRWPEIELIDDNHADALWLAAYAMQQLVGAR